MSVISERILSLIEKNGISYGDLSKATNIPKSALQRYATGETTKIPIPRIEAIARALGASAAYIMGWDDKATVIPPCFNPMPRTVRVPRLGTISCGDPIDSAENFDGYDEVPELFHADFTLEAEGDSMIGARIQEGDVVYIRQQQTVENGQIAAVLIDGTEKLLKRVYINEDSVILQAENPAYPPRIFVGEEMNRLWIIGLAVGFSSLCR